MAPPVAWVNYKNSDDLIIGRLLFAVVLGAIGVSAVRATCLHYRGCAEESIRLTLFKWMALVAGGIAVYFVEKGVRLF